jgi:hypothetical protein
MERTRTCVNAQLRRFPLYCVIYQEVPHLLSCRWPRWLVDILIESVDADNKFSYPRKH